MKRSRNVALHGRAVEGEICVHARDTPISQIAGLIFLCEPHAAKREVAFVRVAILAVSALKMRTPSSWKRTKSVMVLPLINEAARACFSADLIPRSWSKNVKCKLPMWPPVRVVCQNVVHPSASRRSLSGAWASKVSSVNWIVTTLNGHIVKPYPTPNCVKRKRCGHRLARTVAAVGRRAASSGRSPA
jgi:hypothetical protein